MLSAKGKHSIVYAGATQTIIGLPASAIAGIATPGGPQR